MRAHIEFVLQFSSRYHHIYEDFNFQIQIQQQKKIVLKYFQLRFEILLIYSSKETVIKSYSNISTFMAKYFPD
jgi:hypothetical protein